MRRFIVLSLLLLLSSLAAWGQAASDFSLTLYPAVDILLGPGLADGTALYTVGGGLSLRGDYTLPFARFLYTGLVLDVDAIPINSTGNAATLLSLGAQLGVQLHPLQRLGVRLAGYGGEYAGMISAGTVFNPFFGGMADLGYLVSPSLSLGLGASFKYSYTPTGPA